MCGIAGIVVRNPEASADRYRSQLEGMLSCLNHRGPDASGVVVDCVAAVGSCRLRIVGLDAASDQPVESSDSACALVFNGEIYNYVELREELKGKGHPFRSDGDAEVILHAYEEWGAQSLQRLNGMFAFAIVDRDARRVFIARDRFGVKPLYYSLSDELLIFASEPKALLCTGLVSVELNHDTVVDYLTYGITDFGDATFFSRVRQLPAGHFAVMENGAWTVGKWYHLPVQPRHPQALTAASDLFTELLSDSIRLRLRSDVEVGVLLSGGVDSSSIMCLASRISTHGPLPAFCVSFPGSDWNEEAYARVVADMSSSRLTVEPAMALDLDWATECIRAQQEPFISPSIIASWLIMKAVNKHAVRVLLSGQGADECLAGYEYFDGYALAGFLADHKYGEALRHLLSEHSPRRLFEMLAQLAFVLSPATVKSLFWKKRWLKPGIQQHEPCEYRDALLRLRTLADALRFHVQSRLPELLRFEDRNSMAFSIETRHPFLDYRIVEFALACPTEFLVGVGSRKRLLRLAVRAIVPAAVLARREKIGFQTSPTWLESVKFRNSLADMCMAAPQELREIIDFDRLPHHTRVHFRNSTRNDLWRVYNLLVWYRENVVPAMRSRRDSAQTNAEPEASSPNRAPVACQGRGAARGS